MTNDSYRVHTAAMGLIRLAHHKDLPLLREVERAAGESFRDLGMGAVANNEPLSVKELSIYQRAGHAWVTVDETGRVAGYCWWTSWTAPDTSSSSRCIPATAGEDSVARC
jgi:hypothetical protein